MSPFLYRVLGRTLLALLATPACVGAIHDDTSPPEAEAPGVTPGKRPSGGVTGGETTLPPGGGGASTGPSTAGSCQQPQGARSPLRRLTSFEYDNTVRDLFAGFDIGVPSVDANMPGDNAINTFDNEADHQRVVQAVAEGYLKAAELVAQRVLRTMGAVAKLTGCDPAQSGEPACLRAFVATFARRAYRRPLDEGERMRLERFLEERAKVEGFEGAVRAGLERVLQSPQFLYRLESGEPGKTSKVTGHDLAVRLSYLYWGTMPDAELSAAADMGRLADRAEVRRQTERLLASPRAREALGRLFSQWLGLGLLPGVMKDEQLFPMWNDALKRRLVGETMALAEETAFDPKASWGQLYTAKHSFLDEALARFYGVAGPKGDRPTRVEVESRRAAGVLGHASLLAMGADDKAPVAVFRGVYVRERLMCEHLPSPPENVPTLPEVDPKVTSRQRNLMHSQNPSCASCHKLIDPIGFGFEHFDAVGRWRDDDNGAPIDDSGEIVAGGDADGPFKGVAELGRKLGGSETARRCLVENVFRFSFGRAPEAKDRCTIEAIRQAMDRAGGNLREALVELPNTDAFVYLTKGGV